MSEVPLQRQLMRTPPVFSRPERERLGGHTFLSSVGGNARFISLTDTTDSDQVYRGDAAQGLWQPETTPNGALSKGTSRPLGRATYRGTSPIRKCPHPYNSLFLYERGAPVHHKECRPVIGARRGSRTYRTLNPM